MVVEQALQLPAHNRIKPTCRAYPGVEPVQVRKWIRNLEALQAAEPSAKLVQRARLTSPPALAVDDGSETESVSSTPPRALPPAKRARNCQLDELSWRADCHPAAHVDIPAHDGVPANGLEELRAASELLLIARSGDECDIIIEYS